MQDVNVLAPLMVSLSNHARSSLRQAQAERIVMQFLFHCFGKTHRLGAAR